MADETVTLTAQLKDQMSAPLEKARGKVDGFTDAVVTGAKKQAAATDKSTAQIDGALRKQSRLFGGMNGPIGRATSGASRLFSNMRSSISSTLARIAAEAKEKGEKTGRAFGAGLNGTLKTAVGVAAGIVGAGMFASLIAEAGAASDATDKFKSTMNFAGLDTSAITQATADAKAFADQTVYDLPTIQKTMATLAANGVKNYTDLTKSAGNLNAVAGGNAETFKSVSLALGQSAGAGKLMAEDWNMLADAIPGASGQLQKAMKEAGAFEGNFKKAMENGEITAEEFQSAIIKLGNTPIASEAAKSTKTFEGALGNLQATINSKLMTALDKIKPAATAAIGALADGLGKALDWTGDAAQGLYDLIVKGDFSGAFSRAFNVEEDSPVVDMLFDIRDAAIEIPDKLKAVADKIYEYRDPITVVAGLILTLLIPRFVQMGIEAMKAAIKTRVAWAMTQGAAMRAAAINVFAAWQIIGGWVLMAAVATVNALKIAASWLIALGPIGWAIGIIALLIGAFVWAYNNVEWFRDGVDAAMKWIGDAIKAAADWAVGAWNNVVDWWNTTLMPALAGVGQWFSDLFTNIGNWLRDFVGFFVDGWGMITDFWNGVLMPAFQAVGDFFAGIFDWIQRLVWNATTIAVFLFQRLVDFWNGVLLPALQGLGTWFGSILNWIYNTVIKPVVDFIVGLFRSLVDFWNLTLIPALQAVGTWFMSILNWIYTTIIQPVINLIVGAFRGIVDFWNGVLIPAFQQVGNFFQSIFDWIYNTIIKPYIDLLVGGFGMLTDFWNNTLKPAVDNVGKWFSDVIGGAISGVGDFIDDLKKGFDAFIKFWTDTLKPIVDAIADAFNIVKDAISGAIGQVGEFAKNPLGGIQDMLGIKKDENGQGIMPSNSGGGVYAGNGVRFAGGGVLGGYAPGRDSILARLSPGESVLVPELTRAIGPQNIMAANAAASGGRPAGSGPSLTSGYSASSSRGGGSTITIGQISINAPVTAAGTVDLQAMKTAAVEAIEEAIASHNRRSYA